MTNQRERIVEELNKSGSWMTVSELTIKIKGSCDSTIARALRYMKTKNLVTDQKVSGHRYGRKHWTITTAQAQYSQPSGSAMTPATAKPSLIQAVEHVLTTEFLVTNKKFSAYDVTNKLRELVDLCSPWLPAIDPAETGTVWVRGRKVPKIEHQDVKAAVHQFYQSNQMSGYSRTYNSDHFEYEPSAQP